MKMQTHRDRMTNELRYRCCSGNGIKKQYQLHIDDKGCHCLVCTGEHDLYAEIQSYKESTDLATLLNGIDPNAVLGASSTYTTQDVLNSPISDYSVLPKTLGGMFNLVREGENIFNGLPREVRAEFNNSVKVFASQFGTPQFFEIMQKYSPTPQVDPQPLVDDPEPIETKKRGRGRPPKNPVNDPVPGGNIDE